MSFPNSISSQNYPAMYLNPYINSIRANDARYDTSLKIPTFTNASDQATPLVGDINYATSTGRLYYYNGAAWVPVIASADLSIYVLKSGDTMTGKLTLAAGTGEKMIIKDDAVSPHGYVYFRDPSNVAKAYYGFGSPGTTIYTTENLIGGMVFSIGSSANKFSFNTISGTYEPFKISSSAATVAGSNINYAGMLAPFNGGRQILPLGVAYPAAPIAGEIYAYDYGAGNVEPGYYNGLFTTWYNFKTRLNSANWCSGAVDSTGAKLADPIGNDFTYTVVRGAVGSYTLTFSAAAHAVTVSCVGGAGPLICNINPAGIIPNNTWVVLIANTAGVATDSNFFFNARQ